MFSRQIIHIGLLLITISSCRYESPAPDFGPASDNYVPPSQVNKKIQQAIFNHDWITTEVIDSLTTDYPSCMDHSKYFVELVKWKQDTFQIYDGCHPDIWRETMRWQWVEDSTMLLVNLSGSPASRLIFSGATINQTVHKIQVDLFSPGGQEWILSKVLER